MDNQEKIKQVFDKYAEMYAEKYSDLSLYHSHLDFFASHLQENSPVIDLACGPGNVIHYLSQKNPSITFTGIDIAPNMLKIARLVNHTCDFHLHDVRFLADIKQQYNGIICSFILPYVNPQEVKSLIGNTHNSLINKGLLYISTMINDKYNMIKSTSSDGKENIQMHYHDRQSIVGMLNEVKYTIIEIHEQENEDYNNSTSRDIIIIAQKTS